MPTIVFATAKTNSTDDPYFRVSLESPELWDDSGLVMVNNNIPIKIGDIVLVDVREGYNAPVVLGKVYTEISPTNLPARTSDFQVLYESWEGDRWSVAAVRGDRFILLNSFGLKVEMEKTEISVNQQPYITTPSDSGKPGQGDGLGPFCGIKVCPYIGIVHNTSKTVRNGLKTDGEAQ